MTRATGNKIHPDKHRLMHIHAPTLYKRRCQRRPATDTESTTRHLMRIYPHHHHHTHTHARTQIQRIMCINFASHTSSSSQRERERERERKSHTDTHTHSDSDTHMYEHRYVSSHAHRLVAPVNRSVLVDRTLARGQGRKRHLHSARRQSTIPSGIS